MPNKRDLKLDKYGISKFRYRELANFCYQYDSWQDILKYKTHTVKSLQITDMPHGNGTGDPTEALVEERVEASANSQLIEQTLIQAITTLKDGKGNYICGDEWETRIYPQTMKAIICTDITYTYLWQKMDISVSKNVFNNIRRYFYYLLDKNKVGVIRTYFRDIV